MNTNNHGVTVETPLSFDQVQEEIHDLEVTEGFYINALTRTLSLNELQVTAHDWLGGFEISVKRMDDGETWITDDEWPVFVQMVESQFAWGKSHREQPA